MKPNSIKSLLAHFSTLKKSERMLVLSVGVLLFAYLITIPFTAVADYAKKSEIMLKRRTQDLEQVTELARKYQLLNSRFERLRTTFDESQISFRDVTANLDKIVRKSIGSDNYDLKRTRGTESPGSDFEQLGFSLTVKSLNLNQLVLLLYSLEQGESPIFLKKVSLAKSTRSNEFRAVLDIFSIGKSQS